MTNNDNKNIKFTGDPVAFDGVEGKRDPKTGKGRFDLIPEEVFGPLFDRVHKLERTEPYTVDCTPVSILNDIANEDMLDAIIKITILKYYNTDSAIDAMCCQIEAGAFLECCWDMFLDLAIHFQKGAEHYGERNCQKGIPKWSFKDSAMRHASQTFAGKTDEPHTISVVWNCWMFVWSEIHERQEADATAEADAILKEMQAKRKEVKAAVPTETKSQSNATEMDTDDLLKHVYDLLIKKRKELKANMHQYPVWSPEYDAFYNDQEKLKNVINAFYFVFVDNNEPETAKEPAKKNLDEMRHVIDDLKKLAEDNGVPIITAIQHSYTREEVEAINQETIEDYLTKRDNVTEIVQKIVKQFGAPCIIKALDEFNELMYNGDAFIHEFVKFMDTPEGKERARWFYGPDDLFKDLIDRVENKRGAGQDYHDYVPLLLQLNSAYTEFLDNAES